MPTTGSSRRGPASPGLRLHIGSSLAEACVERRDDAIVHDAWLNIVVAVALRVFEDGADNRPYVKTRGLAPSRCKS